MPDKIHNYTIKDILRLLEYDFQESGIYIDNRSGLDYNPLKHPYRNNNFTILFVTNGSIDVQLNLIEYHLQASSITIIPPQSVIYFKDFSSDIHFITLSFDKKFAIEHTQHEKSSFTLLAPQSINKLLMTSEQQTTLLSLCTLIHQKNTQKEYFDSYKDAINHLFALFLLELMHISHANNKALKKKVTRKENLTISFIELLQQHFRTEKFIRFYADQLYVSESYLAKVIKEVTGKTMGELIDHAIIIEAQLLLANSTLSIAEIADSLQFNTTSFFGKFFKRNVGCSPRAYRKQL
ncbi:MAG: helix-turn-helix transcriptional regulator [Flavobacteriaceae bacterium]|jgi:AraC-like DNA-binding protein|nr:helix-turn-helix transcriptional regulator [Flavobacteriaceae bacterium]